MPPPSSVRVPPAFVALTEHRWSVPVLAHLHPDRVAPFGALAEDLSASRDGLALALDGLQDAHWVERAAGRFGAYRLTAGGRRVAVPCAPLVRLAAGAGLADLAFRKWTLPIVSALHGWTLGFAELRESLPAVSPRALTLALKDMQDAGLVTRTVVGGFPPRTEYDLTPSGRALAAPVRRLTASVR